MQEVILHIGAHKTGSTSLQVALDGYAKGSVKAASFEQKNHSIPIYTIFSEQRYNYSIWKRKKYTKDEIDNLQEEYLTQLKAQLSDERYQTLLISGEDISALRPGELDAFLKLIHNYNLRVKAVYYVRNPLDWIVSATQERIKNGGSVTQYNSLYKGTLAYFLTALGKENLFVFSYEEALKAHGSVVKHFSEFLSLDLEEPERENQSLNPLQLALIDALNKVPLNIQKYRYRILIRRRIVKKIIEVAESSNPNFQTLEKKYFEKYLGPEIPSEMAWLRRNFDVHYPIERGNTSFHLSDYVQAILAEPPVCLERIFSELGVFYDPEISLTDNFFEAYFALATENKPTNFCAETYLSLNPDVKEAGVDPYKHYLKNGINEGRPIRSRA